MKKSNIAIGQMFIYFDKSYMEKPRVMVKIKNEKFGNHRGEDTEDVSLFVDDEAIAQFGIGVKKAFDIRDKWNITDTYYGKMVREGKFVPVDDLAKVDDICLQLGWPTYLVDPGY